MSALLCGGYIIVDSLASANMVRRPFAKKFNRVIVKQGVGLQEMGLQEVGLHVEYLNLTHNHS